MTAPTTGLKAGAARGVVWSVAQQWGKRLSSLAVFVLLARLLEPSDFGLLALASVFVALAAIIQEQGFGAAVVQREDLEPEHLDAAFWFGVGSGLALCGLVQVLAGPIAALFDTPDLESVLRVLSAVFVLAGFQTTPAAVLRRALQFKVLALRDLLAQLIGGAVGIALAFAGAGVWALVAQQVVAAFVAVITLWTATTWRPRPRLSRRHLWELQSFGWNVLGIQLLGFSNRRSDDLLIGAFLGPVALGFYSVAYRVLTLLTELFVTTISAVTAPTFARLQRERDRLVTAFLSSARLMSFVAFPAFLLVSALAPEIILAVFGSKWSVSIPVMRVLALVGVMHASTTLISSAVVAVGRPGVALRLNLFTAVLNVGLFLLAVLAGWGILGVATVYVVRAYVMFPANLLMLRATVGVPLRRWGSSVGPSALAGALMYGTTFGTTALLADLGPWPRLVVGGLMGALTYGVVILLLDRSLPREAITFLASGRGKSKAVSAATLSETATS